MKRIFFFLVLIPFVGFGVDMLTPAYYSGALKVEVDAFLRVCQSESFHHPLQGPSRKIPEYFAPGWGEFGAGKGPKRTGQHHPATDLKMDEVALYAVHDGVIATVRNARKYRNYISITKEITGLDGKLLGKLVTLYAHIDLDLDEASGLKMDGKTVKAGELLSRNLWSGTKGGPHLHFEIRYYRPTDKGTEEFYGFRMSQPGTGKWPYGFWDPNHGFGYGHPKSHGLEF